MEKYNIIYIIGLSRTDYHFDKFDFNQWPEPGLWQILPDKSDHEGLCKDQRESL